LWSGGLDSTYRLWQLLKEGPVYVAAIDGSQCAVKQRAEYRARQNLMSIFTDMGYEIKQVWTPRTVVSLGHAPDLMFAQPAAWLLGALEVSDGRVHSRLEVGYVSGDQILPHLEDLRQAWRGLQAFTKHHPIPIEFPLIYTSKLQMLEELPGELLKHVWHCELPLATGDFSSPEEVFTPCGKCPACITAKVERYRYELKNGMSYEERQAYALKQAPEPGPPEVLTEDGLQKSA
jgi:hypothetical protein